MAYGIKVNGVDVKDSFVTYDDIGGIGLSAVPFGSSPYGELGIGPEATNISNLSVGSGDTAFVRKDGSLWGIGYNLYQQFGQGNTTNLSSPKRVGSDSDWDSAETTNGILFAIKKNGSLWASGYNGALGILGLGDMIDRSIPTQVGTLTNWKQISVGGSVSAVKTDGTLWAWGNNNNGQLGLGDITHRSSPVQVGSLTNWKQVSCGDSYTTAIKTDGTLWSWGNNTSGQLGLGDRTHRSSPVQLGALTNWKQVSCGSTHTLAIKTDGTLWAWGTNSYGQLGLGDITHRSSPVQVGSLTNWKQVSANKSTYFGHTAAIKTDGTLWVWGYNSSSNLGLGDTIHRSSPVQLGSMNNWTAVQTSYSGIISLKSTI